MRKASRGLGHETESTSRQFAHKTRTSGSDHAIVTGEPSRLSHDRTTVVIGAMVVLGVGLVVESPLADTSNPGTLVEVAGPYEVSAVSESDRAVEYEQLSAENQDAFRRTVGSGAAQARLTSETAVGSDDDVHYRGSYYQVWLIAHDDFGGLGRVLTVAGVGVVVILAAGVVALGRWGRRRSD